PKASPICSVDHVDQGLEGARVVKGMESGGWAG
ncbi:hypothetical protein E2320_011858, partial [Naja naja]